MTKTFDYFFDFGSLATYLAHTQMEKIKAETGASPIYLPMLLGAVFKATGNVSPVSVPAKGKYMLQQDLPRFAARYGVPLTFNPHFPINTLNLMRAAVAAQQLGCSDTYLDCVFDAIWVEEKNMGDAAVVEQVLADAGLDAGTLIARSQDPEVKAELVANTEAAVARGVFGAPTLFMDGAMYFGQDRLDFIEEALQA